MAAAAKEGVSGSLTSKSAQLPLNQKNPRLNLHYPHVANRCTVGTCAGVAHRAEGTMKPIDVYTRS
jgi:hypothetical protein